MKYQIVGIGKKDAWHGDKNILIGKTGEIRDCGIICNSGNGWMSCNFDTDTSIYKDYDFRSFVFHRVKLKKVKG